MAVAASDIDLAKQGFLAARERACGQQVN
jgi:hypothetical protein